MTTPDGTRPQVLPLRKIKMILLIIVSFSMIFLSGCAGLKALSSNYMDIANLMVISTLGFDDEDGNVRVSVSASNGQGGGQGSQEGGGQGGQSRIRMSEAAPSISLALMKIQDSSTVEELYLGQISHVLLGEKAATDTSRWLDYLERASSLRAEIKLIVVRGGTADTLIEKTGGENSDISKVLDSFERDMKIRGDAYIFNYGEVALYLARSGAALVCAVSPQENKGTLEEDGLTVKFDGYAILKEGKLCGFLPEEPARGVSVFLGNKVHSYIFLENGVSVELSKEKTKLKPIWDGNKLTGIDVQVSVEANIVEMNTLSSVSEESFREEVKAAVSETVKGWVETVLNTSSSYGADFLSIGQMIEKKDPQKWQAMSTPWPDALSSLDIKVTVKSVIARTYQLYDPVSVDGGSN